MPDTFKPLSPPPPTITKYVAVGKPEALRDTRYEILNRLHIYLPHAALNYDRYTWIRGGRCLNRVKISSLFIALTSLLLDRYAEEAPAWQFGLLNT